MKLFIIDQLINGDDLNPKYIEAGIACFKALGIDDPDDYSLDAIVTWSVGA
jgi:hypothetical protein